MSGESGCGCAGGGARTERIARVIEQVWPARMAFPPSAPYLGAALTRAEFSTIAERITARVTSGADASRADDYDAEFDAINAGIDPALCSNGWGAIIASLVAHAYCLALCDRYGGTVSNFIFNKETCQMEHCTCDGADSPPPPRTPRDFTPVPFGDDDDEDRWADW